MTPRWTSWSPNKGNKRRDAKRVAEMLRAVSPRRIYLPFAHAAGELMAYQWQDDDQRLLVTDVDPAIRACWHMAAAGRLYEAALEARDMWRDSLDDPQHRDKPPDTELSPYEKRLGLGRVSGPWCQLRAMEPGCEGLQHAAWAIAVGAGSWRGNHRRNPDGGFNSPLMTNHKNIHYNPEVVFDRIFMGRGGTWEDRAKAADAFMKDRIELVGRDWNDLRGAVLCDLEDGAPIFWASDKPYGDSDAGKAQYTGVFTRESCAEVASFELKLAEHGANMAIWSGYDDIGYYVPGAGAEPSYPITRGRLTWDRRETKVALKAARTKKDGTQEPQRYGRGGLLGVTPSTMEANNALTSTCATSTP